VADLANLKISVDSRDAKSAANDLNALGAAAEGAERDVRNVGTAAQSTGSAMRNMTNIIQQGEQAQIAAANANRAVGQTGQLARHHMMNLGFQFQDLGVQIASGANPLTAFVQQGAQIAGVMAQAQIGIMGVVRAFGAMVGAAVAAIVTNPILLAIAAAATLAYAAFKQFQSAVAETGEIKDYANSLGLTKKEMRELENVHVTFGDVLSGVWTTISEGLGLDKVWQSISEFAVQAFDVILKGAAMATAGIYAYFAGSFDAIRIIWKNLPAILGDLFVQAVNFSIKAVEMLVNAAVDSINFITTKANGVLTSMGMAAVFAQVESVKLGRVANENAGAAAAATVAVFDAYASRYSEALSGMKSIGLQIKQNTIDATKSRLEAQAAAIIAKRNEGKPKKAGLTDEQKQFERDLKASEEYLVSLEKQAAAIGKTAIELKEMEIAEKAAAAAKVGLKDATLALGAALLEGMRAKERADANKEIDATIKALENELSLLGLTGAERDRAALALEREGFIAKYVTALGIDEATAAYERYAASKEKSIAKQSDLDKRQKEAEKLKETLAGLVSITDELFGGAGSFLQNLGKQITIVAPDLKNDLKAIFDDLPKKMQDVFKDFGGSLATILANAAIGKMVGGGTGGAIGGALGGSLGKKFGADALQGIGKKIAGDAFGKALGSMAGPLGAIAGGLIGGLVGGLLKKTKTGSVTLNQIAGGAMERTLSGNSAQLKGIANNMANGLLKGLGNIAEQLGGALGGNVKVSLGMRKKDYVVDPTGAGRTKGSGVKNFGTDEAAAVAYITQLAIQQGIVTGISAGAQTLIRAGNDLNEQVQKALKFDQVFKDLVKESDPLQASLDELSVEMEKLKGIFAEAGASAADYAKLEELYAIKQAKAIFDAARPRRELEIQLMEAQGDAVGALAAKRALELEGIDANLRGLQQQIYAAEDAAKAAEALAEAQTKAAEEAAQMAEDAMSLARDRRTLEIELMDALGNSTDALAARRALELEGMDATLRGLQTQIWAANDARVASEAAAEAAKMAAEEQSKALEAVAKLNSDRRELEIQLLEAQGNAVEALAARRAIELEAMDASLVAIKMQIWAAEAKADVDAEAAKLAEENLRVAKQALDLAQRRRVLEIDLMDAMGNSTEALAARRAMELEAIDETLRGIQLQIWAAQDAAVATQQLADAQAKAAQEAEQIAQASISLARDRRSLEIELLDALGNSTEALVQRRQMELSSMDDTLRGLQMQIWAAQDAREASAAAAEAAKVAAEEQARQLEFVADLAIRRRELEIELLDAQGMAVEALTARRAMELESMDATLRGLKEQIFAAQDKAKADELLAQAAKERAEIETKALEEAAKAAQDYQDALINVTQTIVDEVNRLRGINASSSSALLKAQFATLTAQARTGNLDALGKLPELSRSIEEATLGTATSALEVARIRAWLAASLTETLGAQATTNAELSTSGAGLVFDGNQTGMANSSADTADGIANMRNEMYNVLYQVAKNTGKSYELMDRWDGDGLPDIREDASDYY
jgi:hypothetical protein